MQKRIKEEEQKQEGEEEETSGETSDREPQGFTSTLDMAANVFALGLHQVDGHATTNEDELGSEEVVIIGQELTKCYHVERWKITQQFAGVLVTCAKSYVLPDRNYFDSTPNFL